MPRNGSGTFTKTNTFSDGAIITAAGHNENWDDAATELTNSVAVDGQSSMTGPLKASNGSAASPSLTFASDTDTGFYRLGANEIAVSIGGSQLYRLANVGLGIRTAATAERLLHIADATQAVGQAQIWLESRYNGSGAGVEFVSRTSSGGTIVSMAKITADAEGAWNTTATTQDAALNFYTAADGALSIRMILSSAGQLRLRNPAAEAPHILFDNAGVTPPTPVGGAIVYAASNEVRVMDTGGNITVISPHNFEDIPEGPSEPLAWSFRSERGGQVISADMTKALRLLEKLTGETIIHIKEAA